jgi:transposase InsO family protein
VEFLGSRIGLELDRSGHTVALSIRDAFSIYSNISLITALVPTFRKECLNAEIFASLTEARVIIEKWRRRYNERRPHSSQNYITPEMAYFGVREKRKA